MTVRPPASSSTRHRVGDGYRSRGGIGTLDFFCHASVSRQDRVDPSVPCCDILSPMTKPVTVLLLAGGDSPERDVSLDSAKGIDAALRDAGYQIVRMATD